MKKRAVIIFAKYPELGKVKTRLALTTSNQFALKIYEILSQKIFNEIEKLDSSIDKYLFYLPTADLEKLRKWVDHDFHYSKQKGGDLGQKMSNAFEELFLKDYEKVIIVGTDVPCLSSVIIYEAFESLNEKNVVIAPSDDGGYSLLGLDSYYPQLFENIEWSTYSVLTETQKKIVENKLSYKILAELNDIDTKNELSQWLNYSTDIELIQKIKSIARKENIKL